MIASDTVWFYGLVFRVMQSDEDIAEIECLRSLSWQPILGLILLLTGCEWTISTKKLVMERVWVVGLQNADIADTLHLRDVAMATIFWLSVCELHIGTTWRIWLNHPCAAEMRPYVKLLWPLVWYDYCFHDSQHDEVLLQMSYHLPVIIVLNFYYCGICGLIIELKWSFPLPVVIFFELVPVAFQVSELLERHT